MDLILNNRRRPDITFHADGRISITARIARILRLSENSCINIAINNGEYLLTANHYHGIYGNRHARCHPVNRGYFYFRANSVALCRAILKATRKTDRAALLCGDPLDIEGKTYLPIITRMPL